MKNEQLYLELGTLMLEMKKTQKRLAARLQHYNSEEQHSVEVSNRLTEHMIAIEAIVKSVL